MRALIFGLVLASACRLPNPDHCANKIEPGNVFCSDEFESRPFCSPCEADNNGCVREEPTACDAYDPEEQNAPSTGTGQTQSGTESGTQSTGAQSRETRAPQVAK